jgi:hypothetical protein
VREAPDPPGKRPAQLDAAEINDGRPLADRRQTAGMAVMKIGDRRIAAQAALYDHRQ